MLICSQILLLTYRGVGVFCCKVSRKWQSLDVSARGKESVWRDMLSNFADHVQRYTETHDVTSQVTPKLHITAGYVVLSQCVRAHTMSGEKQTPGHCQEEERWGEVRRGHWCAIASSALAGYRTALVCSTLVSSRLLLLPRGILR